MANRGFGVLASSGGPSPTFQDACLEPRSGKKLQHDHTPVPTFVRPLLFSVSCSPKAFEELLKIPCPEEMLAALRNGECVEALEATFGCQRRKYIVWKSRPFKGGPIIRVDDRSYDGGHAARLFAEQEATKPLSYWDIWSSWTSSVRCCSAPAAASCDVCDFVVL